MADNQMCRDEFCFCKKLSLQAHCPACPEMYIEMITSLPSVVEEAAVALDIKLETLPHVEAGFICPHTRKKLIVSCKAKSCGWWIPFSGSGNCLFAYVTNNKLEAADDNEIAYLFGIGKQRAEQEMSFAIRTLRQYLLSLRIPLKDFVQPGYTPPDPSSKTCCVCGRALLFSPREDGGYLYCGEDCLSRKPPSVIDIEVMYKGKIEYLIQRARSVFRDDRLAAQAFGLPGSIVSRLANSPSI